MEEILIDYDGMFMWNKAFGDESMGMGMGTITHSMIPLEGFDGND